MYEIVCFYKKGVCRFVFQSGHFFLELDHYFFLNFGLVLEAYTTLCVTELDFLTKTFFPKNGPNWAKGRVLKLLKNVVISFFCIWSVIKVYTNLYFYTNSAFGKILAPEICAEMLSANQNTEWIGETGWLFARWYKSLKNFDLKIFGWAWSNMSVASLGTGLQNWLYEGINEI